jgi:hypothetical protein
MKLDHVMIEPDPEANAWRQPGFGGRSNFENTIPLCQNSPDRVTTCLAQNGLNRPGLHHNTSKNLPEKTAQEVKTPTR